MQTFLWNSILNNSHRIETLRIYMTRFLYGVNWKQRGILFGVVQLHLEKWIDLFNNGSNFHNSINCNGCSLDNSNKYINKAQTDTKFKGEIYERAHVEKAYFLLKMKCNYGKKSWNTSRYESIKINVKNDVFAICCLLRQ